MLSVFHTDRFLGKHYACHVALWWQQALTYQWDVALAPLAATCRAGTSTLPTAVQMPQLPSMLRSHQHGNTAGKKPSRVSEETFVTPEATIYCGVPGMLLCVQTAPWLSCLDAAVTGTETSMPLLQHWLVAKAGTSPCQWAGCHMNR